MSGGARPSFEALSFRDGRLVLLDQRKLPSALSYHSCASAAAVAEAIQALVVRGAPAIGCAAAYGVAVEALRLRDAPDEAFDDGLRVAVRLLGASRPTAVNLAWALGRMQAIIERRERNRAELLSDLLEEAGGIAREDVENNRRLGEHGAALLEDGTAVMTHCNAGALATVGHGTALGVIRSAVAAGKRLRVFAGETRPVLQGARLTAWELETDGIPVTLITDNMVGHLMARGEIQAVIVGTDRVAANGDVANKIGTYMVAVLAQRHGIPFYVASPLSSVDLTIPSGRAIPIEERDGAEVVGYGGVRWAPPGVKVRNPAFDVTPAELVTALITERGVIRAPDSMKLHGLVSP